MGPLHAVVLSADLFAPHKLGRVDVVEVLLQAAVDCGWVDHRLAVVVVVPAELCCIGTAGAS